jgi:D-alanine--poly(phosphoribitol) ligase subunit 2
MESPQAIDAVVRRLADIFVESLHLEAPPADTDLFESGVLDSLQLVELLVQLERSFGVQIAIESIDLDNLRTLARIARLVTASIAEPATQEKKVANG